MGFGSYDESEQDNQSIDTEESLDGVEVHADDHDGDVNDETDASTEELVDQLQDIKSGD